MRKKKTAIQQLLFKLEERQRYVKYIDDEQAYILSLFIGIAQQYLSNEQKQIIKAYKDGIEDMAIGQYYKPKHYYENNYGTPVDKKG